MATMMIEGGKRLSGTVLISGRKNSAVAILPATLLADTQSAIDLVPMIEDVRVYIEIMRSMGIEVTVEGDRQTNIDPGKMVFCRPPQELVRKLRSSYYLLGVMLGRFGRAEVPLPGGCEIGLRPIDQHVKGLTALGAEIRIEHGTIYGEAPGGLNGATIYLDVTSVGATINIMLAATKAKGLTVIENAAKEPHIVDLANCLNSMGARIIGAGTDTIKVHGVETLNGTEYAIIPDEIEAATYMFAVAGTGGTVKLDNVIPKHLDPITAKLRETGAVVEENGDHMIVSMADRPSAVSIKTLPYPGFPTDAQQPITALLTIATGTSFITESVWESRFRHIDELNRMGAQIKVEGRTAMVTGVLELTGASVTATDLRAGAALVIGALMARGRTNIACIEHVHRGYENITGKLQLLGANVINNES